jgi:hypothetical protein
VSGAEPAQKRSSVTPRVFQFEWGENGMHGTAFQNEPARYSDQDNRSTIVNPAPRWHKGLFTKLVEQGICPHRAFALMTPELMLVLSRF